MYNKLTTYEILSLVLAVIVFMLFIWNLKLMGDVEGLSKENADIRQSIKEEKIKREGEDYSLNMRFDNLVHYVDKGEYAK